VPWDLGKMSEQRRPHKGAFLVPLAFVPAPKLMGHPGHADSLMGGADHHPRLASLHCKEKGGFELPLPGMRWTSGLAGFCPSFDASARPQSNPGTSVPKAAHICLLHSLTDPWGVKGNAGVHADHRDPLMRDK